MKKPKLENYYLLCQSKIGEEQINWNVVTTDKEAKEMFNNLKEDWSNPENPNEGEYLDASTFQFTRDGNYIVFRLYNDKMIQEEGLQELINEFTSEKLNKEARLILQTARREEETKHFKQAMKTRKGRKEFAEYINKINPPTPKLNRTEIRKIAKKYDFKIYEFVEPYDDGHFVTRFTYKKDLDFYHEEQDMFETIEHCENYFRSWSEKLEKI